MACGRRLGIVEIAPDRAGIDMVLFVPGWTSTIWAHLRPSVEADLGPDTADFDASLRQLRFGGLAEDSPAKQLAVLLRLLTKMYVHIEGKENFGFD